MWPLLPLAIAQSLLLAAGQMFLKLALRDMGTPAWQWRFIASQLTNWWWLATGASLAASALLWMYILRRYPFSMAYPLTSMSYAFGMVAAMAVFHESVGPQRWLGVALIMAGCCLIAK